MTGDGTSSAVVIDADDVTVKNLHITNFEIGIQVNGESNFLIQNKIEDSSIAGILINSDDNTVRRSILLNNNVGIGIQDGNDNEIRGNTITGDDTLSSIGGIALEGNSDFNTIKRNIVSGYVGGILVNGSLAELNFIIQNMANNNDSGIGVVGTPLLANYLLNNQTNDNDIVGIAALTAPVITNGNECQNNGLAGSIPTGLCSPQP